MTPRPYMPAFLDQGILGEAVASVAAETRRAFQVVYERIDREPCVMVIYWRMLHDRGARILRPYRRWRMRQAEALCAARGTPCPP
jgi:hypothetical protein